MTKKKETPNVLLLGKWDISGVVVNDPGLKSYIGIRPLLVPKSFGRHYGRQFYKSRQNIVERVANKLIISGHKSKKHVITSGQFGGHTQRSLMLVKRILETIEDKAKKNPVQVLVTAVENSALMEEITSYQIGGIMVRRAVVVSPQRRVDWALRLIVQGAYRKAFNKKKTIVDAMVDEIMACYGRDPQNSNALHERERIEREAEGAR